jgi:hypothetical protein
MWSAGHTASTNERMPLFRHLGVSLRSPLCGVALFMPFGYYASAGMLGFLDLTKNRLPLGLLKTKTVKPVVLWHVE